MREKKMPRSCGVFAVAITIVIMKLQETIQFDTDQGRLTQEQSNEMYKSKRHTYNRTKSNKKSGR